MAEGSWRWQSLEEFLAACLDVKIEGAEWRTGDLAMPDDPAWLEAILDLPQANKEEDDVG
jgi:hypothetical protein